METPLVHARISLCMLVSEQRVHNSCKTPATSSACSTSPATWVQPCPCTWPAGLSHPSMEFVWGADDERHTRRRPSQTQRRRSHGCLGVAAARCNHCSATARCGSTVPDRQPRLSIKLPCPPEHRPSIGRCPRGAGAVHVVDRLRSPLLVGVGAALATAGTLRSTAVEKKGACTAGWPSPMATKV